ncbi:MAG: hypothetical protein FNP40_13930 [Dehalobacter sp. 4CP]|uniref:hypothetical protein n=1 Tax=Dehalobacter sp. CP TaxID=2594474 RepID=UPI0013CD6BB3|nr:hypothetical protein [Dehalobacter sp. 4CP]
MQSIIVKKLHFSSETKDLLSSQIGNFEFSPETGEGIRVVSQNTEYINCHYLIEKIYSQDTYNFEIDGFEKIEYKRIELVPFFIDLEHDTLDIIGNKQKATKVIEFLGKVTKYKIAISDTQINLLKLVECCRTNNIVFVVSKVKIADYTFFDNIIGDCVLNLSDYPKTLDVLKKFEKQIVNVSISITTDESYFVTFYKSGSISIYKDIESIDIDFLRLIKQGI